MFRERESGGVNRTYGKLMLLQQWIKFQIRNGCLYSHNVLKYSLMLTHCFCMIAQLAMNDRIDNAKIGRTT